MDKLPNDQKESIYGRGWLLAHYLLMESARRGQLTSYVNAIADGKTQSAAAVQSFGDLKLLEKELDRYRTKPLLTFKIGAAKMRVGDIAVTRMTNGGAQVVLTRGRLKYGAKRSTAEQFLPAIRALQVQFPGDELVETTLAEAELLATNAKAAEAAADRALKTNMRNTEAMVLKGRSLSERALEEDEPNRHDLFEQARRTFIAANKIDPEDPEPLFEFYRAHLYEGIRPPGNAIAAMHYASDLAPQDFGLRMNSAIAYLNEDKPGDARGALTALAYSPHGGGIGEVARRMIAQIDAGNVKGALNAASGPSSETRD
ncbi:MAG TPA: hypothetical protein VF637_11735, partial [Sphingomicrobium sp.]